MRINKRHLFSLILAAALALQPGIVSLAETTVKDYRIPACDFSVSRTQVLACWDAAESRTDYRITLYRDSIYTLKEKVGSSVRTSQCQLDVTDRILETGTGYYFFEVYSINGGTETTVKSGDLEIGKADITNLKEARKDIVSEGSKGLEHIGPAGIRAEEKDGKAAENAAAEPAANDGEAVKKLGVVDLNVSLLKNETGSFGSIGRISGRGVKVENIAMDTPRENWVLGSPIHVTATVRASSGYEFTDSTAFRCSSAEAFSYTVSGPGTAAVSFEYYPRITLQTPSGLRTTDYDTYVWSPVPHAESYRITLITSPTGSRKNYTVSSPKFVFSSHNKTPENYIAISISALGPKDSITDPHGVIADSKERVYERGEFCSAECQYSGKLIAEDWRCVYYDVGGKQFRSGWKKVGLDWYYFDENGNGVGPGWFTDKDGNKYFFNQTHQMMKGEIYLDGKKYTFNDGSSTAVPEGALIK